MTIKEIKDGMEKGKVLFGIRQALKVGKKGTVFIAKDSRDSTVSRLEDSGVEFSVLKTKKDLAKELNLDFESEVISIK